MKKLMSGITNFFGKKSKKKEEKSTMAMNELITLMNEKHNDFEFGAEARVVIQHLVEDLKKED